jgi:hypothetical protein
MQDSKGLFHHEKPFFYGTPAEPVGGAIKMGT